MAKEIVLNAASRTETGSAAARRLLKRGLLPAVIGVRGAESIPIQMDHHAFDMLLRRHTGENLLADLSVDDQPPRKVLLTEVQREGISDHTIHADFQEISMTETMRVDIPLELVGDAAGLLLGGILEQILFNVEIECLPGDLVESIAVDVSAMQVNDTLTLADIDLPPALTIVGERDLPVVHITMPKAPDAETAEGEAVAEGKTAEPEVITKGKKEEEGEA